MSHDQILKRHFVLMEQIISHYTMRNSHPAELEKAVRCCREQIALAPQAADAFKSQRWSKLPSHAGFEQLAVIREERGEFVEAVALYKEAKRQGWGKGATDGRVDWDAKIKHCKELQKQYKARRVENQPSSTPPMAPSGMSNHQAGAGSVPEAPAAIHVICPHCQTTLIIPIQFAGKRGMCRDCQGLLDVPAFSTAQEAALKVPR